MIAICLGCESREANCKGACACTIDGRDIKAHVAGGDCPRGKFTGGVSLKVIAHAAVGIARAVTGTGGASDELVAKRTAVCNGCEQAILSAGIMQRCKLCGCSTWAKVRNADERCPAGKW